MRRRALIAGIAGASAWPLAARAQPKAMPVIGFLSSNSQDQAQRVVARFHQGLGDTGYVVGRTIAIEYRWADGRYDRLPALAADLIGRKVDLTVAGGGPSTALAAKSASATVPIVFVNGSDPVADGLVPSLAHPGGNITGVSFLAAELTAKRLDLLSELVPQAKTIALLVNPGNPNAERVTGDIREAARLKRVQLEIVKGASEGEIDAAFAALVQRHAGALLIGPDPVMSLRTNQIVALAARHGIPTMYFERSYATAGGLISYGPSIAAAYRQAGAYVGRILKGEKPADLPVVQSTTFELVVNLRTARTLGLTVPPSILTGADEVIE